MLNSDIKKKFYNGKKILEQKWSGQTIWGDFSTWEKYWNNVETKTINETSQVSVTLESDIIYYKESLNGTMKSVSNSITGVLKVGYYIHMSGVIDGERVDMWHLINKINGDSVGSFSFEYKSRHYIKHYRGSHVGTETDFPGKFPTYGYTGNYWYELHERDISSYTHNDLTSWEFGFIWSSSGNLADTNSYVRSSKMFDVKGKEFKIDFTSVTPGRYPGIYFYDKNDNYQGYFDKSTESFRNIAPNAEKYKLLYRGTMDDISEMNIKVSFK